MHLPPRGETIVTARRMRDRASSGESATGWVLTPQHGNPMTTTDWILTHAAAISSSLQLAFSCCWRCQYDRIRLICKPRCAPGLFSTALGLRFQPHLEHKASGGSGLFMGLDRRVLVAVAQVSRLSRWSGPNRNSLAPLCLCSVVCPDSAHLQLRRTFHTQPSIETDNVPTASWQIKYRSTPSSD